jgi:TRAP-type uncharacterized transport system fused permease subunit
MWASGWAAMRAAAPAYIVPFMFVYEPALLLIGDWLTSLHATITAILGVILLSAGLFGYLLRPASAWQRAALVVAALLLIKPGWITDLAGATLAIVVVGAQLAATRGLAKPAA